MLTIETCVRKYEECKLSKNGDTPNRDEFLKFAKIGDEQLVSLFGSSAYSRLQSAAGDTPNKFGQERTPLAIVMNQYGNLVMELGVVPASSEWKHRHLKPPVTALRQNSLKMKWTEFPERFVEWVTTNKITGFDKAIDIITATIPTGTIKSEKVDEKFLRLIKDVRAWTPARRRSSEESYKVELRGHLKALKYDLNEEFGESKYDLLVQREYAMEVKKDPDLAEYDRLFGQVARHLQHQCKVIVLILEATRNDKYDNFTSLVDKYLNVNENSVEIIKK